MTLIVDTLTIQRVANGWIIKPGPGAAEFTHIAATPEDLAGHVKLWAQTLPPRATPKSTRLQD